MWWLIGVAVLIVVLLIGAIQTQLVFGTRVTVSDPTVPHSFAGFRIAQVSDYHDSPRPLHGQRLVKQIRDATPDLIVLTGDLFDRRRPDGCKHALAFVAEIVRVAPVAFVDGNHEWRLDRYPEWRKKLIRLGVMILEDEAVTIYRKGQRMRLVGMRQVFDIKTLQMLCHGHPFSLVLSHRCECVDQYTSLTHALVLTGHAHGGQIRLFGLCVFAPKQGAFPRFTNGLYRRNGVSVYISRGIGNTIHFPRIFNAPEWNLITLSDGADKRRE